MGGAFGLEDAGWLWLLFPRAMGDFMALLDFHLIGSVERYAVPGLAFENRVGGVLIEARMLQRELAHQVRHAIVVDILEASLALAQGLLITGGAEGQALGVHVGDVEAVRITEDRNFQNRGQRPIFPGRIEIAL